MSSFLPTLAASGRCLTAGAVLAALIAQGQTLGVGESVPAAKPAAPASVTSNSLPAKVDAKSAPSGKIETSAPKPAPAASAPAPSAKGSKNEASKTSAPAVSGKATAPLDMNWFTFIPSRNIFNPNRRGPVSLSQAVAAPRVDSFTLVGVMSYDKGQFAFFDGTSTQYKQALKVGGKIDAYTVTEITNNKVKLKTGEKELEFNMGMQMRREGTNEWKMSARPEAYASASGSSSSSGSTPSAADAAPGSALERLLKKRAEEAANK